MRVFHKDFFGEDWKENLARSAGSKVFVIGNPPWVTNSELGQLGSQNLPEKTNFQGLRGFDARTGKSNFDIAEWMLMRLVEALPSEGVLAVLCKTMTARKVLRHFWKTDGGREGSRLFLIDAKAEFDVAVDACLFVLSGKLTSDRTAEVFADLNLTSATSKFGFVGGDLVSNTEAYEAYQHLDGVSAAYTWRSGLKHDAAKVMEFTRDGRSLVNGLGEVVDLEDDYLYPLLKSSDLGNGRLVPRKSVLVPQRHTGDDTAEIKHLAPKTWRYLERHSEILDGRKSSIYKKRSRFCVLGIGSYSFALWKVAISGLYKNLSFVVIPPCEGSPVMVDDTCYTIPCRSEGEARLLHEVLSSEVAQAFLSSLVFIDSKRPVTVDVLRRLSIVELAKEIGRFDELKEFLDVEEFEATGGRQMSLLMESKGEYRAKK